ncbi:hypothetical protein B0J13DRAFT_539484 [Dactylonectria estremocensis]|uniref:BHLH domain-containing protein n=1 Tax=Dactylonectria estremocensis TaxID=1079267 RepID=A0A9P9FD98_9HYPO|nr:hypothetical protein B0J13DRAFT_539484 [Dactylonectria estremocensis]
MDTRATLPNFEVFVCIDSSHTMSHCRDRTSSEVRHAQFRPSSMGTACQTPVSAASNLDSPAASWESALVTSSLPHPELCIDSYELPRNQAYPYLMAETTGNEPALDFALFNLDCGLRSEENSITFGCTERSLIPQLVTIQRNTMPLPEAEEHTTSHLLPRVTPVEENAVKTSIKEKPDAHVLCTASRKPKHSTSSILSRQKEEPGPTSRRTLARNSHNQVEKKYRNRLNQHFLNLLNVLPRILEADVQKDLTLGGNRGCKFGRAQQDQNMQLSKGEVLEMARRYIQTLKQERDELHQEINGLLGRDLHEADDDDILNARRAHGALETSPGAYGVRKST